MVDVDGSYQLLIRLTRPHAHDPQLLVDNVMPALSKAVEENWNGGYDTSLLEASGIELAGNLYGPDEYPDWPRRRGAAP